MADHARPEWPLVGHADELDAVVARYAEPRCRGVVLVGEPGSGKTSLARRAAEALAGQTAEVLWIAGNEALSAVPFGAMAHLAPHDWTDDAFGKTNALIDQLRPQSGERLVVVVDDMAALDEGTSSFIAHLTAAGWAFLIATARIGVRWPAGLSAFERAGDVARVRLRPFDQPVVAALLEQALDGPVAATTAAELHERSGGNPLYLRELVRSALESESLVESRGAWRLEAPLTAGERLADILGDRFAHLGHAALELAKLLAVAAPLRLSDVAEARDDGEAVAALEALERIGLLTIGGQSDPRLEIARPVHADVLRSGIRTLERRRLVARARQLLMARSSPDPDDDLRVVDWELELGISPAADTLVRGARLAHSVLDHHDAARYSAAALAATGTLEMRRVLVESLMYTGRSEDAEAVAAEYFALGTDDPTAHEERGRLLGARVYNMLWYANRADLAWAAIDGERSITTDPATLDELLVREWYVRVFRGDPTGELLRSIQGRSWSPAIAPQGHLVTAQTLINRGDVVAARAELDRADAALAGVPDPHLISHPSAFAAVRAWLELTSGDFDAVERTVIDTLSGAGVRGNDFMRAYLITVRGKAALASGNISAARRHFADAVVAAEVAGNQPLRAGALGMLATACAQLGDREESAGLLAELELLALPVTINKAEVAHGLGWTRTLLGQPEQGRQALLVEAGHARARGDLFDALGLYLDVARLGAARSVRADAVALGVDTSGPLAAAYLATIEALASGTVEALTNAEDRLERLGAQLLAAETATTLASAHRRRGDGRNAAAATNRAQARLQAVEGARTPALAAWGSGVPLSEREREVAALAADGLTNQEIADRLYVSVRTVGNHLQSVYSKLGISGREELAGGPRGGMTT